MVRNTPVRNLRSVFLAVLISFSTLALPVQQVDAAVTLCSTTTATITQTSAPTIYIDNSPVLDAVYVSYQIDTGASVSFSDLWVQLENFSSANLALAGTEDGLYHVGPVTTAATEHVYFFLAGIENASAQSYDVVLYDGHPTYGGTETCYENRSHTEVSDTIQAVSNKVTSVVSTAPYVGGSMTITVTGDTGTIGAAGIFNYIPASVSSWPADCYELYDTEITLTGGNVGTYYDGLYLSGLNPSATSYTVIYSFTAKCTTAVSTSVTPLNNISSGTQIKHTSTSTSTYTSIPPILPAENQLNLTKSVSPGGSAGGGAVTYTVTARNDSPVPVTIDYFQDTLPSSPASVSYTASSSKWDAGAIAEPDISGQVLTWTDIFTVPAGATKDLTYDASIPATNGSYTNSAVAFVGSTQIDLTKDTTDDTPGTATHGVGDPNFGTSTKTSIDANGGDLVPGDTISYTLTLINSGTIDATVVNVDDTIDTNTDTLTNVVIAASGSDCGSSYINNSTGTALNIDALDVTTAANCIITFDVTVKAGTPDQTSILNTATISAAAEGGVGGFPSSDPLTVDVDPFLTLAKVENDADDNVTPGQVITYTVTVGNTGLADATGVDLDDTIGGTAPINIVDNFTLTNCGTDYVNNSSGVVINVDNVDVATATDCVITYDVTVDGTAVDTETITNSADVSAANEGGNDPGSVAATTQTVLVAGLDPVLGVTKTEDDADNVVSPGQTVTYTITISNTGTETGTTSFTDTIDTDFGTPGLFGFTNCGGSEGTSFTAPTLTVSNLVVTTAADCVVAYSIDIDDPLDEGATLTNSADVAQAAEGGNNPNPVAASTLTVDATPNLSTSTKTENDADNTVVPGQTVTYTLTIINTGNGGATGVDITDTVDTDVLIDTASIGFTNCGSSYTDNTTTTQLNILDVDIAVGVNCVIIYDVDVDSPSTDGNTIPNTATISASDEGGPGGTPSSSTLTIDVTPALGVTKTDNDADNIVTPGQTVTYTVTISNTGDGTATTSFTDAVDSDYGSPGSYGFTNCGGSEGTSFTAPTLTVSNLVTTTAANCVVTYDLTVDNPSTEGATITNSADVAVASEGGNNPGVVSADTLTVDVSPTLGVTKVDNDGDNAIGQSQVVTYTITIANTGDGTATGVDLDDTVTGPVNLVNNFIFTNCGSSYANLSAALVIDVNDLEITTAADCQITYDVTITDDALGGLTVTNSADISVSNEGGNDPAAETADTLTVINVPDIELVKTLKSITQLNVTSFDLVYEFVVTSGASNVVISDVQITDDLTALEANGATVNSATVTITDGFASGGVANGSFDGDSDKSLLAGVPSAADLDATGGTDTSATLEVAISLTRPINLTIPVNTATATETGGATDISDSDGVAADGDEDMDTTNDPAPAPTPDLDGDYFVDGSESNVADRDGDGVTDNQDFDPQGYFYCQEDGNILSGGQVQVSGPASVTMIDNGSSGFYQWFATAPGTYTMTFTNPSGATPNSSHNPSGTLDPTGNPNPYSLGSNEYGTTGVLADYSVGANPYYLTFDIEAGDPWIINNNLPFTNCASLTNTGDGAVLNPIVGSMLLAALGFVQILGRRRKES